MGPYELVKHHRNIVVCISIEINSTKALFASMYFSKSWFPHISSVIISHLIDIQIVYLVKKIHSDKV